MDVLNNRKESLIDRQEGLIDMEKVSKGKEMGRRCIEKCLKVREEGFKSISDSL